MAEPIAAKLAPFPVDVKEGETYYWCACGRSQSQPFCDASHAGTGIEPMVYVAPATRTAYFCGCKASKTKPLCDGTHNRLIAEQKG
ncbi:MAG: CDGSH iron-sulfur domain-containing protein [Alphaproteobacteria bacterium]